METPAKTITDANGKVLLFSCDQFITDICEGNCCFICGAKPGSKEFNDEHVFPRWFLKRFNLFDKEITLSNGHKHRYSTYRVSCCKDCNSFLGKTLEVPVSQLLLGSYSDIRKRLDEGSIKQLFIWLCLIFFKTHMKDRFLRVNLDPREGEGMLADDYYWQELHHLHAVIRSTYVGAELTASAMGSILILPIKDPTSNLDFDWIDLTNHQTLAVRIGDMAIVAVLNDCCAAMQAIRPLLQRITGPITITQLRELAVRMAVANDDLVTRPWFATNVSLSSAYVQIIGKFDTEIDFLEFDPRKYGAVLYYVLRDTIEYLVVDGDRDAERIKAIMLSGNISFLFNNNKEFIANGSWVEEKTKPLF